MSQHASVEALTNSHVMCSIKVCSCVCMCVLSQTTHPSMSHSIQPGAARNGWLMFHVAKLCTKILSKLQINVSLTTLSNLIPPILFNLFLSTVCQLLLHFFEHRL